MNRSMLKLGALAFIILAPVIFTSRVSAQTFRGTLIGTVTDSSGGAIAGTTVRAKNTATGVERATSTSEDGSYSLPELPVGLYDVTFEKAGFQSSVIRGIEVEIAHDRRVDAVLKVGDIAQKVEVSAETVTLAETTNNNLGGLFTSTEVTQLPINGGDFNKLLIMAPGTTGDPSGAADSPGSYGLFSSNGNRGRSNNFLLDGTDMNDSYRNLGVINQGAVFAIPGTILPVDAIGEVRLISNMEAEYGRSSGAVVNIVTKSGTNDIHGAAFEQFGNDHLNARNFFDTVGPKDAFRNNQFGFALGGPIIKNKTFWYVAYEGQREGLGLTSVNTVPSLADYASAIESIPGGNPNFCNSDIFTCVTSQPDGVVNPVILNFFNLCQTSGKCSGNSLPWPTPNVGTNGNISSDKSRNDLDSFIVKVDHNFNQNNNLTGRYFYGRSEQSLPLGTAGGNNIPNTNTFSPTNVNLGSFSYVRIISPDKVNELRFGFNRFHEDFLADDASVFGNPLTSLGLNTGLGTTGPGTSTAPNPNDFGLPVFAVSGYSSLGSSRYSNPRGRVDENFQIVDNFSWKKGKHDIHFGGEWRYTHIDNFQDVNFRGRLKFTGLQSFLEGNVDNGGNIAYGNTKRKTRQTSYAFYFQDSIRLTPKLTANLGLRWDYYGVIHMDGDQFSLYDATNGLRSVSSPYDKDLNNFAPRLSLAYDLTGKGTTVIRAGFGVFYDTFSHDFFTGQIYYNSVSNYGPAYNPFGNNPVYLAPVVGTLTPEGGGPVFDSSAAGIASASTDLSTIAKLRTPYMYNYSLNIQQQLLPNTVLQVGYVGTAGRKLQRVRDINQPSPAVIKAWDISCAGAGNPIGGDCVYAPGPFANGPTFPINGIDVTPFYVNQVETSATSNYNSLQISLNQHNWHRWTNQVNYTWSHSIDTASDGQDYVPNAATPVDSTHPISNKGNSNFDTRNRFVWSSIYDFPKWEKAGRWGSGFQASVIVSLMSGHPFNFINSGDNWDGTGEFSNHPDLVGKVHYNYSDPNNFIDMSQTQLFIPCTLDGSGGTGAANCLAGTRHIGNLGRNSLLGPAYRDIDFSFSKDTAITERFRFLFRVDFFNLFNHPNFSNPLLPAFVADLGAFNGVASNGRITGVFPITATVDTGIGNPILGGGGPRSIQFTAKFQF